MASGNAGSVRVDSLTKAGLKTMENHERRLDRTGARRSVRKDAEGKPIPALIYDPYGTGTGEDCLLDALAKHVEGARINKAAANVARHAFIQWPVGLDVTPETEEMMLQKAVEFVNKTHGGNAVFRGRLDRDEKGRHGVDVFFAPVYEKTTKRGSTKWVSLTKFGKQLAAERFGQKPKKFAKKNEDTGEVTWEPVLDENGKAVKVDCDSKWYQGRALQDEWFEFLRDDVGLDWVVRGDPKIGSDPDRLEPEAFGLRKDLERLHSSHLDTLEELERRLTAEIDAREKKLDARAAETERKRKRAFDRAMEEVTAREKAVQEAEERVAALDAREKELEEREATVAQQIAALDAREKEVEKAEALIRAKASELEEREAITAQAEKEQASTLSGIRNILLDFQRAFSLALNGEYLDIVERTRQNDGPVFNAAHAEGREPTVGFCERFYTLHISYNGKPKPYIDDHGRKTINSVFDGLDKFATAQKRIQERERAVQGAEERLKPLLATEGGLRASVSELEARKATLEGEITAQERANQKYREDAARSLQALAGVSQPVKQAQANVDAAQWAIEHVLDKAGLSHARPDIGYKGPDGDPPPLRELIFGLAREKARDLLAVLSRSGPTIPGPS